MRWVTPAPEVVVSSADRRVLLRGVPVELTRLEFDLLRHLCEHPDQVHRDAADVITTVRGVGYLVASSNRVRLLDESSGDLWLVRAG